MALLITWINFNTSLYKQLHTLKSVGRNYLSISKVLLKFGNGKVLSPNRLLGIWLPIHVGLKLNYVSKRGPWKCELYYLLYQSCHVIDFKFISARENICFSIHMSIMFVPKGPIDITSSLLQLMAWHRKGWRAINQVNNKLRYVSLLSFNETQQGLFWQQILTKPKSRLGHKWMQ